MLLLPLLHSPCLGLVCLIVASSASCCHFWHIKQSPRRLSSHMLTPPHPQHPHPHHPSSPLSLSSSNCCCCASCHGTKPVSLLLCPPVQVYLLALGVIARMRRRILWRIPARQCSQRRTGNGVSGRSGCGRLKCNKKRFVRAKAQKELKSNKKFQPSSFWERERYSSFTVTT